MNLIELNTSGGLDVYTLNPNSHKVKTFKERILQNKGVTFASLRTNNEEILNKFLNSQSIPFSDVNFYRKLSKTTDIFSSYSESIISYYQLDDIKKNIIDSYLEGYYNSLIPQIITSESEPDRYLLRTTDKVSIAPNRFGISYQTSHNLILTQKLYLLQLIETSTFKGREVFTFIRDHRDLFEFSYTKTFPDFESLLNLGIIKESDYNSIIQRTEEEAKLIKSLKKKKKGLLRN